MQTAPDSGSQNSETLFRAKTMKIQYAGMAELADALDSGSSEVTFVQVQVLLPAPNKHRNYDMIKYHDYGA